ncbi:MAG: hypothetical protein M1813_007714 [Trichoglossum hirsutum]|nr:MAG: hypothetical protein M1813_007714 [Trichoglossum hirsutum]
MSAFVDDKASAAPPYHVHVPAAQNPQPGQQYVQSPVMQHAQPQMPPAMPPQQAGIHPSQQDYAIYQMQSQQMMTPQVTYQGQPQGYLSATPLAAVGRGATPVDCPACGKRAMTRITPMVGNTTQ